MTHIEMIIDYITDGTDFQYNDNHGVLVRCKDCKHLDKGENESEAWSLCVYKSWQPVSVGDEHFCSWGERKDGDSDELCKRT